MQKKEGGHPGGHWLAHGRPIGAWAACWLTLAAGGPAFARPVDETVSQGYLRHWSGRIHYCPAGQCTALGKRELTEADQSTFRPLSERYAADRSRVYYEGTALSGADPASLRVIGPDHAADRQSLFIKHFRVTEIDPATARYLPRHYVLDQHQVWYGEFETHQPNYVLRKLAAADPQQFRLPDPASDTIATDGHRLYQRSQPLPVALNKDFRLLEHSTTWLAFVSDAQLHVLAYGLDWPDKQAVRAPGTVQRSTLLTLSGTPSIQGKGAWRLLNNRWLLVEQDRRWRLLRDGARQLTVFGDGYGYAVVDGTLWYAPPRWENPPMQIGPVQADLRWVDTQHMVNDGQVFHRGQALEGADATRLLQPPR